jgi:phosphate:Na+ symporter
MEILFDIIFGVLGGLGIFIYGMQAMSSTLQEISGDKLRKLISTITHNRFLSIFLGLVVTAIIQSSSITTVMVVGFVNATLMTLKQALGIILGANIGSTVTGWLLILKIGKYSLLLIGLGALGFTFSRSERRRKRAFLMMSFGMIFFGLELMKNGMDPLGSMPKFLELFKKFEATNIHGVIFSAITGAVLTALLQSSAATVGITMALASQGLIHYKTAVALVLGENIGTTITAFLASIGTSSNAKKAAYAHIFIKVVGVSIVIPFFTYYVEFVSKLVSLDNISRYIAVSHTIFNMANAIIFLPFLGYLTRFLDLVVKDRESGESLNLESKMVRAPFIVLEKSKMQILLMDKKFKSSLESFKKLIASDEHDRSIVDGLFKTERELDSLKDEVTKTLMDFLEYNSSHKHIFEIRQQLSISDVYESFGDYGAGLAKLYLKLKNNSLELSVVQKVEIQKVHELVMSSLEKLSELIKTPDLVKIEEAKKTPIQLNENLMMERNLKGKPLSYAIYVDILAKYRRINRHIIYVMDLLEEGESMKQVLES